MHNDELKQKKNVFKKVIMVLPPELRYYIIYSFHLYVQT